MTWRKVYYDILKFISGPDSQKYVDNVGDCFANAIKITISYPPLEGVRAEYDYLSAKFGRMQVDWEPIMQRLTHDKGKPHDVIEIRLIPSNERKIIYFNIESFYRKPYF